MRLKEISSNWHASSIIKRDYKHDSSQPNRPARHKAKKDRARWCRGKVGVPHVYRRQIHGYTWTYITAKCVNCGHQSYSKAARNKEVPLQIEITKEYDSYLVVPNTVNHPYTEVLEIGCGCEYCFKEKPKWHFKRTKKS